MLPLTLIVSVTKYNVKPLTCIVIRSVAAADGLLHVCTGYCDKPEECAK